MGVAEATQQDGAHKNSDPSSHVAFRSRNCTLKEIYPAEKVKESEVQKQILEYLALKRVFHYRNNSGAFVDSQKHFYRFGALGSPDIICVINGQFVGIEVKALKGKQSEHQKEFQRKLEAAGGKYVLAYNLDDVINDLPTTT